MKPTYSLALTIAALLGSMSMESATAQVPDGYYVVCRIGCSAGCTQLGGLDVVHPRSGATWPISGLPNQLTGQGSGIVHGGNAVAYWPEGEALVVGPVVPTGQTAALHVVYLRGLAYDVSRSYSIPLGTIGPSPLGGGGVSGQIAWMSSSTVLVTTQYITGGPLTGADLVIVNLQTRATTPITVNSRPQGLLEAVAFDPATGNAFATFDDRLLGGTGMATVVRVNLTSGAATQLLSFAVGTGATTRSSGALLFDPRSGELLVPGGTTPRLRYVNPRTGRIVNWVPLPAGLGHAWAFEKATNGFAAATQTGVPQASSVFYVDNTVAVQWIAGPLSLLTGIDVNPNPEAYGASSPAGVADYRLELWPNPGGLPLVGNGAFALRVGNRAGANEPGLWFWGTARGQRLLHGMTILVGGTLTTGGMVLPGGNLALPIPNNAGLVGLKLCLQTAHVAGTQLTVSEGVELTVL